MPKATSPAPSPAPVLITATPIKVASFALVTLLCLGTLIYGLLPGLLAVCLGYLMAVFLTGENRPLGRQMRPPLAAAVVVILPLVLLGVFLANAKGMAFGIIGQYQALLHFFWPTPKAWPLASSGSTRRCCISWPARCWKSARSCPKTWPFTCPMR